MIAIVQSSYVGFADTEDEGFDYRFVPLGQIVRCRRRQAKAEHRSAGAVHLDGIDSQSLPTKKPHPRVWFLLAEDEGFEPPQTESESGVLPLHKSSI